MGNMSQALEAYLLGAHFEEKDVEQWKRIGFMAFEQGRYKQSIYCLNKVIRHEVDNIDARWHRALAYEEIGDWERAIGMYTTRYRTNLGWNATCTDMFLVVSFRLPIFFQLVLNGF